VVVEVVCDGGAIEVRWDGVGSVYLIGKVEPIFEGTLVV
jgi:diaminopimelate epimerase